MVFLNKEVDKQRREYLRVKGRFSLIYRLLTGEEYQNLYREYQEEEKISLFSSPKKGEISWEREGNLTLSSQLLELNRKLDLIINLLTEEVSFRELRQKRLNGLDISGAGARFLAEEELGSASLLEIKFLLPSSPFYVVKALGEVARAERLKEEGEKEDKYQIAIKFLAIKEEDQNKIIRYAFKKEKETLRNL